MEPPSFDKLSLEVGTEMGARSRTEKVWRRTFKREEDIKLANSVIHKHTI